MFKKAKRLDALTVHYGAVGLDGPLHDAVVILEVDDNDLRLGIVIGLLPYADEVIRL